MAATRQELDQAQDDPSPVSVARIGGTNLDRPVQFQMLSAETGLDPNGLTVKAMKEVARHSGLYFDTSSD